MRKHLIGTFRTRAFRLRVWKVLNAVVAVVTIANVSLVGALLPQAANAIPSGTLSSGGSGSIWTTKNDCGTSQQDVNHFGVGDHVYINGSNFLANHSYAWQIKGTPGSNDPNQVIASGNHSTNANGSVCFDAYTVQSNDGGEYKTGYADKNDNYQVDKGTLKINKKVDADGDGTFEGGNTTANGLGFSWDLNGGSSNRAMGSEVDMAVGNYLVTEHNVTGYHFVGWYPTGSERYSCSNPKGTTLPVSVSLTKDDATITFCNAKDEVNEPVTINAWKIVCTDEADLPNWGASGGPDITPTTAQNWVNSHESCSLTSGWDFQWAPESATNPGDNTGAAGAPWTTFGPTNGTGLTTATIENYQGGLVWVREVWQNGYIPFTMGQNYDNSNDVSAEMYCHTDVINYDNFDWIAGIQPGGTYNCVAWNVAARQPQGTLHVYKQADTDGNGTYELTVTDTEGGFGWNLNSEDPWNTFGTSMNLAPGEYTVAEKDVTGYHMTGWRYGSPDGDICGDAKLDGGNPVVNIADNQDVYITFCNAVNIGINGTKYYDWDRNAETSQGDEPLANWTIFLDLNHNWQLDQDEPSTVTDQDGQYSFPNLTPNEYEICEVLPNGWTHTPNPAGQVYPQYHTYCKYGVPGDTVNFYNYLTGVIHGQKFNDLNGNGIRDCSAPVDTFSAQALVPIGQECEPSLNGWTVFLDDNGNGALDEGERSMQTQFHDGPYFDDNGWYWFEDLQPGSYKVCEVQQSGWSQTYPVNANGNCHTITVPQGGEGDTCFNPLSLQLDIVENAVVGPTCNFGNQFVPVTTINLVKDGPASVNAGDNITYTLNWSVAGNTAATNATITDPIPANTTFVSADNGGTLQSNIVVWNLGTKNPGDNGTVSVTVKSASPVTDGTLVTNTATFDTDQTNPKLDDANTTLHFTPPPTPQVLGATTEPNLTIAKSVNKDTAKPGDVLTYTITVTSTGTGDAESVIVTDTLPDDFSFAEGSGKTRTWDLGTLAPGQSSVINVDVRVESDAVKGDYINVATADADGVDQKQASVTVAVSNPQVLGLATTGSTALDYLVFALGTFLAVFGLVGLKLRRAAPVRVRK